MGGALGHAFGRKEGQARVGVSLQAVPSGGSIPTTCGGADHPLQATEGHSENLSHIATACLIPRALHIHLAMRPLTRPAISPHPGLREIWSTEEVDEETLRHRRDGAPGPSVTDVTSCPQFTSR